MFESADDDDDDDAGALRYGESSHFYRSFSAFLLRHETCTPGRWDRAQEVERERETGDPKMGADSRTVRSEEYA